MQNCNPPSTSVKFKRPNKRYYYNDGYRMRAACVCVKNESENEVLLVSSSNNKSAWVVPGGGIEENEKPDAAAQREAYEEAGVLGIVDRLLGIFENEERKIRTHVFLFRVENELDEWEENILLGRQRNWFHIDQASNELFKHKPTQCEFLKTLKGFNK